jgi:hypothetical protein
VRATPYLIRLGIELDLRASSSCPLSCPVLLTCTSFLCSYLCRSIQAADVLLNHIPSISSTKARSRSPASNSRRGSQVFQWKYSSFPLHAPTGIHSLPLTAVRYPSVKLIRGLRVPIPAELSPDQKSCCAHGSSCRTAFSSPYTMLPWSGNRACRTPSFLLCLFRTGQQRSLVVDP